MVPSRYSRSIALGFCPEIERRIAAREFALHALLGAVKCLYVPEPELRALDPELASLRNLNRPEDLA